MVSPAGSIPRTKGRRDINKMEGVCGMCVEQVLLRCLEGGTLKIWYDMFIFMLTRIKPPFPNMLIFNSLGDVVRIGPNEVRERAQTLHSV
jgi:hypothetical protein